MLCVLVRVRCTRAALCWRCMQYGRAIRSTSGSTSETSCESSASRPSFLEGSGTTRVDPGVVPRGTRNPNLSLIPPKLGRKQTQNIFLSVHMFSHCKAPKGVSANQIGIHPAEGKVVPPGLDSNTTNFGPSGQKEQGQQSLAARVPAKCQPDGEKLNKYRSAFRKKILRRIHFQLTHYTRSTYLARSVATVTLETVVLVLSAALSDTLNAVVRVMLAFCIALTVIAIFLWPTSSDLPLWPTSFFLDDWFLLCPQRRCAGK